MSMETKNAPVGATEITTEYGTVIANKIADNGADVETANYI